MIHLAPLARAALVALLVTSAGSMTAHADTHSKMDAASQQRLDEVLKAPHRSAAFKARDQFRNPAETLAFFGVRNDMTVVEIYPGGGYYMEILAPFLSEKGQYIAAAFDRQSDSEGMKKALAAFDKRVADAPTLYGKVQQIDFGRNDRTLGAANSADMVLTFRNVHNFMTAGMAEDAFKAFFDVLKPGGVLGVVEHRAATDKPQDPKAENGYVREDYVIEMAQKAGFKLDAKSEINANPKDTKDYAKGVWTLPPNFAEGEATKAKYEAIGESDRMTLRFVKPAS